MLASRMMQTQEVAVGLCSKIHSEFKTEVHVMLWELDSLLQGLPSQGATM